MSQMGLVSRVSPVHTAVRNCTRDEGGPFEVGNQLLISSHRKLLWSKATVVPTGNLIRLVFHLVVWSGPAIHNLGAMDVLCTDKTGTLTAARIKLMRHVEPMGQESERVFELAFLNSHFETGLKSPLDNAILEHGRFDTDAWRKIDEVPFDFERRRVSVLLQKDAMRLLIVKGAPEDILRLSTQLEATDGSVQPMTPVQRVKLRGRFEQIGAEGMRALGIATRQVGPDQGTAIVNDETELTFAGFAVFLDPPKASAGPARSDPHDRRCVVSRCNARRHRPGWRPHSRRIAFRLYLDGLSGCIRRRLAASTSMA